MLHCKDLTVLSVKYGPFNMDFKIGRPIINRISLLSVKLQEPISSSDLLPSLEKNLSLVYRWPSLKFESSLFPKEK